MINPVRKHIRLSFITFLLLFFAVSFLIPQEYSYAHKVQMFAHVEGSKVFVEGYFADGKKAKNSEVTVFDNKSGERLLGGKTPTPPPGGKKKKKKTPPPPPKKRGGGRGDLKGDFQV